MPLATAANGASYIPAQPIAIQAVSGAGGQGMPVVNVTSPDPASQYIFGMITGFPGAFAFPLITQQANNNIIIISTSTDISSVALPGLPGQAGAAGGLGAAGIVAGGFSAGWGGDGFGRDKNGVVRAPGGPMTVVYIVATA